jgi:hypothetical protein
MILWTIQPIEVYELIQKTGIYRCTIEKSIFNDCKEQYDWLVQEVNLPMTQVTGLCLPCGQTASYDAFRIRLLA